MNTSSTTVSPVVSEAKKFNLDTKYVQSFVDQVSKNPKKVSIAKLGVRGTTEAFEVQVDSVSYGFTKTDSTYTPKPNDPVYQGNKLTAMLDFYS